MSCFRKNSIQVGISSRDELECMRDSPAYQMHSSAAGTSFDESSPQSSYPAPSTYLTGHENTHTKQRLNGRNASPVIIKKEDTLLKTALANANRNTSLYNSPKSTLINGRPSLPSNGNSTLNGHYWDPQRQNDAKSPDEMSTSILRNPAWYRQPNGQTGVSVPRDLLNSKHIQQTEIKPRNSSSRSPTPERFTPTTTASTVRRTSSMETQRNPPQKYLNGSPSVQPRSSSLFQKPNIRMENGFGHRSTTDYGVTGNSLLKNGLERRGSSQSVSSRGSLIPKTVTFSDRVVVNEIARKQDEDDDEDAERCSVSPRLDEPLPTHTGQLLQLPSLNTSDSHSSDDPSPNSQLTSHQFTRLKAGANEELRNSPSLNLDEIVYETHRRRPESLSEDEWKMIKSIYVPSKIDQNQRSSLGNFQPISVDVGHRQLGTRHSLSPIRRHPISPNLNETRKIFQPNSNQDNDSKTRIFGQFSPPPRRRLQPNRFNSPTRETFSPPSLYDLRAANQRELAERQTMEQNQIQNGHHSSFSPTRQFSVVPPNRSLSPNYRDLSPRNWTVNMPRNESPVRNLSPKLPSPRLVLKPNITSNGYEASDELTPVQTAKRPAPVVNQIRPQPTPSKPPLPNNILKMDSMQQSFYDNVNLQEEQDKQKRLTTRFGRPPQRPNQQQRVDDQTPPPSDPEPPRQLSGRKESNDSIFSNTSRDSIFSITSLKSDIKLRRNFNY